MDQEIKKLSISPNPNLVITPEMLDSFPNEEGYLIQIDVSLFIISKIVQQIHADEKLEDIKIYGSQQNPLISLNQLRILADIPQSTLNDNLNKRCIENYDYIKAQFIYNGKKTNGMLLTRTGLNRMMYVGNTEACKAFRLFIDSVLYELEMHNKTSMQEALQEANNRYIEQKQKIQIYQERCAKYKKRENFLLDYSTYCRQSNTITSDYDYNFYSILETIAMKKRLVVYTVNFDLILQWKKKLALLNLKKTAKHKGITFPQYVKDNYNGITVDELNEKLEQDIYNDSFDDVPYDDMFDYTEPSDNVVCYVMLANQKNKDPLKYCAVKYIHYVDAAHLKAAKQLLTERTRAVGIRNIYETDFSTLYSVFHETVIQLWKPKKNEIKLD